MRRQLFTSLIALWAALMTASSTVAQVAAPPPNFDDYVRRVMERFAVPGLSVAIVKDGAVVLVKGYGVRRLGESDRVDAETLFGIASNTKVFTATALGILVEEGKLEWDAPVVRYLPSFQMYDPWVTRHITVRDLLVHRSGLGLGAGDLMFWPPSTFSRPELVERLRYIPPATSFRSAYAYDNVLYPVAGEVIEAVSGQSWEDFVASRIFGPAGMRGSDVRLSHPDAVANAAMTHARVDGTVQAVTPYLGDVVNPAGGIFSNASDMARWVMVQLDSGRVADGGRVFGPSVTRELWEPVTPIEFGQPPAELAPLQHDFQFYALGLGVRDYRGRRMLTHTGGLPGYLSQVAFIPDLKLGVVVLTNQESGEAFNAITYQVLDHYLGAPAWDWLGGFSTVKARADAALAAFEAGTGAARDEASTPSLSLGRYASTYRDAWYGDIGIARKGEGLEIRFSRSPDLVGEMVHWQHDTFLVRWHKRELRADAFITFALTPGGNIDHATMQPASPAVDFSFDFQDLMLMPVRPESTVPAPVSAGWLPLIGEYATDSDTLSVLEQDGELALQKWSGSRSRLHPSLDGGFTTDVGERVTDRIGAERGGSDLSFDGRIFTRLALGGEDGGTFRIDPVRPTAALRVEALAASPPVEEGDFRASDLVELVTLDPTIKLDIRYATTNNFMGEAFYSAPRAFLQRPAAEALVRAHRWLGERGYGLLIHDGYRPWYVTRMFWDATPEDLRVFVANPANGSRHNRGSAVDLTLYDLRTGAPIEMPGGYDEFSPRSFPDYPGGTDRQRWHRELLREAMERQDFSVYEAEWWHFDYNDWRSYRIGNERFEALSLR
ncbi:MAG: serine hydrolase [Gemmatimonadetes bacterium]|nr:serine hydrolase [Gemmatimonadota bacterium]MDA1103375.1 serine hydrolase [Gemmatimonadota bacterium]